MAVQLAAAPGVMQPLSLRKCYDRDRGDNNRRATTSAIRTGAVTGAATRTATTTARHDGYDRRDRRDETGHRGAERADRHYYGARGPEWRRGGHIPPQYRSRQYVVEDWRGHRLHQPPHGYQWVQVGGDYVLVAIATGIIAQLLLTQ